MLKSIHSPPRLREIYLIKKTRLLSVRKKRPKRYRVIENKPKKNSFRDNVNFNFHTPCTQYMAFHFTKHFYSRNPSHQLSSQKCPNQPSQTRRSREQLNHQRFGRQTTQPIKLEQLSQTIIALIVVIPLTSLPRLNCFEPNLTAGPNSTAREVHRIATSVFCVDLTGKSMTTSTGKPTMMQITENYYLGDARAIG